MDRLVSYFPEFGEQNTGAVIACIARRLQDGDLSTVVVATSSGRTALQFAEALAGRPGLRLIAVGNGPGSPYERLAPAARRQLVQQGVEVLDNMPNASSAFTGDGHPNLYGAVDLLVVAYDTMRKLGGQGLKVAMEVGVMACNAGLVQPGERVIAVGGTSTGADVAIVMKAAFGADMFADEPDKRPEMIELLCMPLTKKYWF